MKYLHCSANGILFILLATAGSKIYASSFRPTRSIALHTAKEIVSFGFFGALMDLLRHDFDGELAILFDLVFQGHDQAPDELLPVVELYELVRDGR